ncbi:glutaminase [Nafulsella turpanensis]|uniref:glutaminase n=1 Tax=Nafulsella turpanensis TaxID=1265690 RepID=UPI00034C1B77|nr:glutaminase [Nafulsella turpanensis]
MDYQSLIEEVHHEVEVMGLRGQLANYIPELSLVDPNQFGICLVDCKGNIYGTGDYQKSFSIQSISKVFTLTMAFSVMKDIFRKRVNVEPSGNPFNSLVQLEQEDGIPRNPFINAGALVITDAIISQYPDPEKAIHNFIRSIACEVQIPVNPLVHQSELAHSSRNRALANFMKSFGNIDNSIDRIIEVYTYHCSLEMSCEQLAKAFLIYANDGHSVFCEDHILDGSSIKRINALMLTCGFYDEAGDFAYKVGLPGKSGVGGGVGAVLPGRFSIAVWSPELNTKGNSVKGIKALEILTDKLGVSLF